MPTWPASLPQSPGLGGYREEDADTAVRSNSGDPFKVRARSTAIVTKINMVLDMTSAQIDTLETFYYTTLLSGSLSFDWVHPRTAAAAVFRFISPPIPVPLGGLDWQTPLDLEILP